MNQITSFRLCTLSNEELLNKVDKAVDEIYQTGKIPIRHIPARPNEDFDLLVGELLVRFKELQSDLNHNIQRCLDIAEERDKALAGTERVECYLPDIDNPDLVAENINNKNEVHYLKLVTLTVVRESDCEPSKEQSQASVASHSSGVGNSNQQ